MINIYKHSGEVITRTATLRGIQDRCVVLPTKKLTLASLPHGQALVHIMWADDSHATIRFNAYSVAWQWTHQERFAHAEYDEAPVIIDVAGATPITCEVVS